MVSVAGSIASEKVARRRDVDGDTGRSGGGVLAVIVGGVVSEPPPHSIRASAQSAWS